MAEPLRVGLAGLGTVGSAVAAMIMRSRAELAERAGRPIELVAYAAKDPPKDPTLDLAGVRKIGSPIELARANGLDVFVELMGGEGDPAKSSVEAALRKKTQRLAALGKRHHVVQLFRSAFKKAADIAGCLTDALLVLDERNAHETFAALAEADPTFDIGGFDTAHKLAILTSLAFGTEVDAEAVHVEGIESISLDDLEAADELGYRVKLLGVAQRTSAGIEQRVHPTMVRKGTVIAGINGVTNAIAIDADTMELTLMGPGAGGAATSASVVADLTDLAAGRRAPSFGRPVTRLSKAQRAPIQRHEGGYYIRLAAVDRPGTAATIARRMADENISLESIVQRGRDRKPHGGEDPRSIETPASVALITYATSEDAVRRALSAIESDGVIAEQPHMIRIEKS